jgi:hypothetical protein
MPPYQDRLQADPGWWRTKPVQAYWAARSPAFPAGHSAQRRLRPAANSPAATAGGTGRSRTPRVNVIGPAPDAAATLLARDVEAT